MKLPRLRTVLLTPLILFALVYIVGITTLALNHDPVAILQESPTHHATIAIFGASGTAGDGILKAALANPDIKKIHVITRRTTPRIEEGVASGKVQMTLHMDYLDYSAVHGQIAEAEAVFWAIGTSTVGVDEKTYGMIHVDFPVRFVAEWTSVSDKPDISFHYISSSDISEDSRMMWAREKVRAEKALFGFAEGSNLRVIAYRPDYIGPTKEEAHIGQDLLYWFFRPVGAAVRATRIGEAMIEVTARGSQFENGDHLGTWNINRYSDAYERRQTKETTAVAMPESRNMQLVGYNDLQGRAAYHPIPHRYGDRMIFFVGHHVGEQMNPMTGELERNGMSVLDVTDPGRPVYLKHVLPTGDDASGTQHVQVCDGSELPNGDPNKVYLVRTNGQIGAELLNATDPAEPTFLLTINSTGNTPGGQRQTHKIQWECETGLAYLNGTTEGWLAARTLQLYDLSNPEEPRHIRDFALDGWQPGSSGSEASGLHQPFAHGNRVYMGYSPSSDGVFQILDRDKLINGEAGVADPLAPTSRNLLYPQIARVDMPSYYGAHTTKPIYGMEIADYADNAEHKTIDLLIVISEELDEACQADRDITFFVDITEEAHPFAISSFQVPEEPGDFCHRGGRFGVHGMQDAYNPNFDKRLVLLSYFNAGVRAVDIRDPFSPREVGYFIPQKTNKTQEMCGDNNTDCAVQIQTNNVNIDDRGYIYIVDRAGTGTHILELTGEAREIVGL